MNRKRDLPKDAIGRKRSKQKSEPRDLSSKVEKLARKSFARSNTKKDTTSTVVKRPGFRDWPRPFLISMAGGSCYGLAWVNESFGWLGIVGIASFFLINLTSSRTLRQHAVQGTIWGFTAYAVANFWMPYSVSYLLEVGPLPSVLVSLVFWFWEGLRFGLIALAIGWTKRVSPNAWIMAPAIWIGSNLVFPSVYPSSPACLLTSTPALLQLAEIGGVHLVGFYVLSIGGIVAWVTLQSFKFSQTGRVAQNHVVGAVLCGLVLVMIYGWGDYRIREVDAQTARLPTLRIGIIQTPTHFNTSHGKLVETSLQMKDQVDLILWPEASLGDYSSELKKFDDPDEVYEFSRGDDTRYQPFPKPNAPLLAGADIWVPGAQQQPIRAHVAALLIDRREELIGCRYKNKLMPFGEFIPGDQWFPIFNDWIGCELPCTPGTVNEPVGRIKGVPLGAMLCFEDMHPDLARELVHSGAGFLVTLGNGMVFNSTVAGDQHFRIARFRAIENRISFVRCTTTGVSGLVRPSGKIEMELPVGEDAAAILNVATKQVEETVFGWTGNILIWSLIVACFISGLANKKTSGS